jgi:superfamily II RNA helicase
MVVICNSPYPQDQEEKYQAHFDRFPYPLSDFQKYSIQAIVDGNHSLVTAATGNGKTVSADFAIQYFTSLGKKVIYTSPIKALSNQKFFDFSQKYPEISFGIFTGDIKYNPNASVIFATAEILMNHLFGLREEGEKPSTQLQFHIDIETELACVVMDECHYILDQDRGHVWENTILMLPKHVQMILLSATLDKPQKFAEFCEGRNGEKQVVWSSTLKRIVPLNHYGFLTTTESIFKKVRDKETQIKVRETTNDFIPLKREGEAFQEAGHTQLKWAQTLLNNNQVYLKRSHVLNTLMRKLVEKEMLPALVFTFSRKNVETCAKEITTNLLEFDSKVPYTIRRDAEQLLRSKITNVDEYLNLPEYQQLMSLLEKGIGIHHSGMIPILREIVEFMISKRQIKALFATDSFSIGLNCEIKTVVFTSLQKFDGEYQRYLEAHQYTQMAGRAGRRNIDTVGHVIHCNNLFPLPSVTEYKQILCGLPQKMESKFMISYGMLLNLVRNGKNTREDFIDFATKSMLKYNLESNLDAVRKNHQEKEATVTAKENSLKYLRTPMETLEEYAGWKEVLPTLVNKRRKEMERNIQAKRDEYRTIDQDLEKYQEYRSLKKEQDRLNMEMDDLAKYIPIQIDQTMAVLLDNDFMVSPNGDTTYDFTPKGHFASHIAEIHCLAFTEMVFHLNFLVDFEPKQIACLLACFADVRVKDDSKLYDVPEDVPTKIRNTIRFIKSRLEHYETEEGDRRINTGFAYKRAIQYDLIVPMQEWLEICDEGTSKIFLNSLWEKLEISSGDFIKAILKISTIAKEWMSICEFEGHIELMGKLQQIDSLILKHICTTQSLYV